MFWVLASLGLLLTMYFCLGHEQEAPSMQTFKDWVGLSSTLAFWSVCLFVSAFVAQGKDTFHVTFSMNSVVSWVGSFVTNRYTAITQRIHIPKAELSCSKGLIVPSVSFLGGGHLWSFAIGVGHHLFENYDMRDTKLLASSCGCFAAVPLACGLDPYVMRIDLFRGRFLSSFCCCHIPHLVVH